MTRTGGPTVTVQTAGARGLSAYVAERAKTARLLWVDNLRLSGHRASFRRTLCLRHDHVHAAAGPARARTVGISRSQRGFWDGYMVSTWRNIHTGVSRSKGTGRVSSRPRRPARHSPDLRIPALDPVRRLVLSSGI